MNWDSLSINDPTAEVRQAFTEKFAEHSPRDEPESIGVTLPCTEVLDALDFLVELAGRTDAAITVHCQFEYLAARRY